MCKNIRQVFKGREVVYGAVTVFSGDHRFDVSFVIVIMVDVKILNRYAILFETLSAEQDRLMILLQAVRFACGLPKTHYTLCRR